MKLHAELVCPLSPAGGIHPVSQGQQEEFYLEEVLDTKPGLITQRFLPGTPFPNRHFEATFHLCRCFVASPVTEWTKILASISYS